VTLKETGSSAEKAEEMESRIPPSQNGGAAGGAGPEAMKRLQRRMAELYEYFSYFLSAKVDGLKASATQAVIWGAVGLIGLAAVAGVAVTLSVVLTLYLFQGLAGGLAALFGGRLWLGELVLGALFVLALGVGGFLGFRKFQKGSREKLHEKYEARKRRQRAEFGRSVEEEARKP
jgi:hypothetical protein